jgi:hypothetical protein
MLNMSKRCPWRASLLLVYIIVLLLCLSDAENVGSGPHGMSRGGHILCNGTKACGIRAQLGNVIASSAYGSLEAEDPLLFPQTAAGFDPYDPCPTTDVLNLGQDLRSMENQVVARSLHDKAFEALWRSLSKGYRGATCTHRQTGVNMLNPWHLQAHALAGSVPCLSQPEHISCRLDRMGQSGEGSSIQGSCWPGRSTTRSTTKNLAYI